MKALYEVPELPGTVEEGSRWIVEHRGQGALASLRWALEDVPTMALAEEWEGHSAGSLVVSGVERSRLEELARSFHLDATALAQEAEPPTVEVNLPRLALYHTWIYTQDSGWARFALEQLKIPYTLIDKDDVRAGELGKRFDVILVPSQKIGFKGIVHGINTKWSPLAYTTTTEFPSHGHIDSSDDITGGMGFVGLEHLQRFVDNGGLLITLGGAGVLAADSGLTRAVSSEPAGGTPGSHITTQVLRDEHPTTWGYPRTTHAFHGNLPRFTVGERDLGMTVMQYGTQTLAEAEKEADRKAGIPDPPKTSSPEEEATAAAEKTPLCLSGQLKDPKALQRKPAILDVPVGQGRVLLYSWNPLHRYQNHHDFAFITNALLFWDDFPDTVSKEEMQQRQEK
jgi:hypothetical protein